MGFVYLLLYVYFILLFSFTAGTDNGPPPKVPPDAIVEELTQNGKIPLQFYYVDDSNKGKGTHYKYSFEDISSLIDTAHTFIKKALSSSPSLVPSASSLRQVTDIWLVHALSSHPISGASVYCAKLFKNNVFTAVFSPVQRTCSYCEHVVFGSTSPWYEAVALALGASHVTVVEYNNLTYDHPNITTAVVTDTDDEQHDLYDAAFSLSSFDHDGLGRYGDPVDPNADLHAMKAVRKLLKPNGLLFLTVPIGPDVIVWNLHRRYGKHRLPRLLSGWEEVECIGWNEEFLEMDISYRKTYEPVFVLRPKRSKTEL